MASLPSSLSSASSAGQFHVLKSNLRGQKDILSCRSRPLRSTSQVKPTPNSGVTQQRVPYPASISQQKHFPVSSAHPIFSQPRTSQEAQQRQEKREQAKAERLAQGGDEGSAAAARRDTREDGGAAGGKPKKPLGCNTCGLTFPDTVRQKCRLIIRLYLHTFL